MNALNKLLTKNNENKFVCVGLDTDIKKIPRHLFHSENPVIEFNKKIIKATKENVAAYKINFAFYEKDGLKGIENLTKTISFIPEDILIIADAKRGDIGNTSKMYAQSVFDYFKCDAITLNPLMGKDSVEPFLEYHNKLNFILALTSNPGSADFEKLKLEDGEFVYQKIIDEVNKWNVHSNCGIVFGATNTAELGKNMERINSLPVLLPGIGAQGGSLEDVIKTFKKFKRRNFLINVSRGIIYKSEGVDFAEAAHIELNNLNNQIDIYLNDSPAD